MVTGDLKIRWCRARIAGRGVDMAPPRSSGCGKQPAAAGEAVAPPPAATAGADSTSSTLGGGRSRTPGLDGNGSAPLARPADPAAAAARQAAATEHKLESIQRFEQQCSKAFHTAVEKGTSVNNGTRKVEELLRLGLATMLATS